MPSRRTELGELLEQVRDRRLTSRRLARLGKRFAGLGWRDIAAVAFRAGAEAACVTRRGAPTELRAQADALRLPTERDESTAARQVVACAFLWPVVEPELGPR